MDHEQGMRSSEIKGEERMEKRDGFLDSERLDHSGGHDDKVSPPDSDQLPIPDRAFDCITK